MALLKLGVFENTMFWNIALQFNFCAYLYGYITGVEF